MKIVSRSYVMAQAAKEVLGEAEEIKEKIAQGEEFDKGDQAFLIDAMEIIVKRNQPNALISDPKQVPEDRAKAQQVIDRISGKKELDKDDIEFLASEMDKLIDHCTQPKFWPKGSVEWS